MTAPEPRTGWEGVPDEKLVHWFDTSVGIQVEYLRRGEERHRLLEIYLGDARREIKRRALTHERGHQP